MKITYFCLKPQDQIVPPSFESLRKVPVLHKDMSESEYPQLSLVMTLHKVVNIGCECFSCFSLLIACVPVEPASSGGVSTPGMNIENLAPATQTNPLKNTIMTIRHISSTKTAVLDIFLKIYKTVSSEISKALGFFCCCFALFPKENKAVVLKKPQDERKGMLDSNHDSLAVASKNLRDFRQSMHIMDGKNNPFPLKSRFFKCK